jgi:hypothetical protein
MVTEVVAATVIAAVARATAWRRLIGPRTKDSSLIVGSFKEG